MRADNYLSARVLWKKSYKQFCITAMVNCLLSKYIEQTWRNNVDCVKCFWMQYEQIVNRITFLEKGTGKKNWKFLKI